jgi:ABC-type transport system involved in multi-copper enzyme maturation permease subunit
MPGHKKPARWRLDWPLLGKELLEQSARRQMYVIRVVYALVLFGAFGIYYLRHLAQGPVLALGRGMGPFQFLVMAQLITIYLFLPPLMAGALAQEKERDTLGLLFLTDLTPWELILQKYVGRLIPMLTLLFLSLPLLAVAYSLGGVSAGMLYASAATLFLTCLWVGALALECSAHEGSTFQALLRCWGICLGFATCCALGPFPFWASFPGASGLPPNGLFYLFPSSFMAMGYLVMTWLFLARAKQILETRAYVQRRNPFAQQFKQLDQYWKDLRKLLRALLRKRDREAKAVAKQVVQRGLGALDDPRDWSLGGYLLARMQIPTVLSFAIIIGAIVLIALVANVFIDPKSGGAFFIVVSGIWILALVTLPIQSANAVASERINERLGAILTTPLTAREILDEWFAPIRRWIQFLTRPLLLIIIVEALVKFYTQNQENPRWTNLALYLGMSLLTVWVYPELVRWSGFWIGLRILNQIRALMTSLLLAVAWCILPVAGSGYLAETGLLPPEWSETLHFLSPITVIRTAEAIGRQAANPAVTAGTITLAFLHLGLAAALMWKVRQICLTTADRHLGRVCI